MKQKFNDTQEVVIRTNFENLKNLPLAKKGVIVLACDDLIERMWDDSGNNWMIEDPVHNREMSSRNACKLCAVLGIKDAFYTSPRFPNLCRTMTITWGDDEPFSDCAIDRYALIKEVHEIKAALNIPGVK